MNTEKMIRELRRLEEKHKDDHVNTFDTRWSDLCHDVANRLEELSSKLENIDRLLSRDIFDIEYNEHKKRGNSCNGAQLQMMNQRTLLWIHSIGYEKTKEMLINDFDTYWNTSLSDIVNMKGGKT